MIGIVNKALEVFVEENLGRDVLQRAKSKAELGDVAFGVTQAYPDGDTYALLGAVCEVSGLEAGAALEAFGRFWIQFAGDRGYGPLIDSAGSDFLSALRGLESLHTRVSLMFPGAVLPGFFVQDGDESSANLLYKSARPHLGPFVLGTLHGLAARHGLEAEILREVLVDEEGRHEERFQLTWSVAT